MDGNEMANGSSGRNLDRGWFIRLSPLPADGDEQHRVVSCVYCASRVSRSVAGSGKFEEKEKRRLVDAVEKSVMWVSFVGVALAGVGVVIGGWPSV